MGNQPGLAKKGPRHEKPTLNCSKSLQGTGINIARQGYFRALSFGRNSFAAAIDWQDRRNRIPTQSISTAKFTISSLCHFSGFG
jgi:hypothetical protein